MITAFFTFLAFYYALSVLWYWLPLSVMLDGSSARQRTAPSFQETNNLPFLMVVSPCRGVAAGISDMADCLKKQEYPADRYRFIVVMDIEGPLDPALMASGVEVYVRRNPEIKTKGNAINELLEKQLRGMSWDALAILDIDVRAAPDFLAQAAAYLKQGAPVIQAAVLSKNPDDNTITRISHRAQLLSQLIQRGRARLGLTAILSGGGMIFTRNTLRRLDWQIATGQKLSDDGELNLRLALLGIPVTYGELLNLRNDLPEDMRAVRLQRRRWFVAYAEARSYIGALLRKGLTGHWRAGEHFFTFVCLPSSSLSFVLGGGTAVVLNFLSFHHPRLQRWAMIFSLLWALQGLYYLLALRAVKSGFSWRDIRRLPGFLTIRAIAIFQGAVLGSRANPGRYSIPSDSLK